MLLTALIEHMGFQLHKVVAITLVFVVAGTQFSNAEDADMAASASSLSETSLKYSVDSTGEITVYVVNIADGLTGKITFEETPNNIQEQYMSFGVPKQFYNIVATPTKLASICDTLLREDHFVSHMLPVTKTKDLAGAALIRTSFNSPESYGKFQGFRRYAVFLFFRRSKDDVRISEKQSTSMHRHVQFTHDIWIGLIEQRREKKSDDHWIPVSETDWSDVAKDTWEKLNSQLPLRLVGEH